MAEKVNKIIMNKEGSYKERTMTKYARPLAIGIVSMLRTTLRTSPD